MPDGERASAIPRSTYRLLDDQPWNETRDPLGYADIAAQLADLVSVSRTSTPLVLGVESDWGMGKSTLMHHIDRHLRAPQTPQSGRRLDPGSVDRSMDNATRRSELASDVRTVWYNAWTSKEGDALEALVKSVVDALDPNIVRRVARNQQLLSWLRVGILVISGWLGFGGLASALWKEASIDPKARNDIQRLITESMRRWTQEDATLGPRRMLVVFVDDLDRCSPTNVVQTFEAIKLYLNAPGLAFIVGYDRSVITDAILDMPQYARAATSTSHRYLEKIVQVAYRLPPLDDTRSAQVLDVYLMHAGAAHLFDGAARQLLIEQNGRNPRRMKRFVNSFVIEYRLDPEWRQLGAESLAAVLLIDTYFPTFGAVMRSHEERDPIARFNQYVHVRDRLRQAAQIDAELADEARELLRELGRGMPPDESDPLGLLQTIDAELPSSFPELARNPAFVKLLANLNAPTLVREKMRRFEVSTNVPTGSLSESAVAAIPVVIAFDGANREIADVIATAMRERFGNEYVHLADAHAGFPERDGAGEPYVLVPIFGDQAPSDRLMREVEGALSHSGARIVPALVESVSVWQHIPSHLSDPLSSAPRIVVRQKRMSEDTSALTGDVSGARTALSTSASDLRSA